MPDLRHPRLSFAGILTDASIFASRRIPKVLKRFEIKDDSLQRFQYLLVALGEKAGVMYEGKDEAKSELKSMLCQLDAQLGPIL